MVSTHQSFKTDTFHKGRVLSDCTLGGSCLPEIAP